MITPLEIKGAMASVITSMVILVVTFTAGEIYRDHRERENESGSKPFAPEDLAAKGRGLFLRSCAQCHGRDADGGEDAPSLLNLQISSAHMTLVIQSGIKGEMPSFSKKFDAKARPPLLLTSRASTSQVPSRPGRICNRASIASSQLNQARRDSRERLGDRATWEVLLSDRFGGCGRMREPIVTDTRSRSGKRRLNKRKRRPGRDFSLIRILPG